jgi:hypothetical protein
MKAPKIYSIYNRSTSFAKHDFPDGLTEQHHAESCDINVIVARCYGFPDKVLFKKQKSGDLFTSDVLTKCWGKGHCLLGDLTFESAAYVSSVSRFSVVL